MKEVAIHDMKHQGGLSTIRENIPDDLLFVCSSYESRTTAATECLGKSYRAKNGVIYHNSSEVSSEVFKNLEKLRILLEPKCDKIIIVEGSLIDPVKQFNAIKNAILEIGSQISVDAITVDSTTFNREALLVAMALLRTNFSSSDIRILYVSPSKMGEWLSHGFREVRSIIGFPGILRANLSTVLVILSGFEPDRVTKLIEEHGPDKVLLGFGNPPTAQNFLQRNIEEQNKTVFSKQDVEKFEFAANSLEACHSDLEKLLKDRLSSNNIILAPMSTKLSTLGAFLTGEAHPEIQLTYCVPGEYNILDYSQGERSIFIEMLQSKNKKSVECH